jgi:hypothetical protein
MLKYLRIAVTAICLPAFVLLVALWVRSYYACDRMSGQVAGHTSLILVSYAGRLSAVATENNYLQWNWPRWDSGPILPTTTFPPPDRTIDHRCCLADAHEKGLRLDLSVAVFEYAQRRERMGPARKKRSKLWR